MSCLFPRFFLIASVALSLVCLDWAKSAVDPRYRLASVASAATCSTGSSFTYDQDSCTAALSCSTLDRVTINYDSNFAGKNASGPNVAVTAITGSTCNVSISKISGSSNCGYKIKWYNSNTRLKIDTQTKSGASDCEMKIQLEAPSAANVETQSGDDDDDKDKDKDKDDDSDSDTDYGITGNKADVQVVGAKGKVKIKTTSGDIYADVTSSEVKTTSDTGDITVKGLTQQATVKTKEGNVRTQYCRAPSDTNKDFSLKIDKDTGDANLLFPEGSQFKMSIDTPDDFLRNDFSSCSSCNFKLDGEVKHYLFISKFSLETGKTDACKY
ncbi:MAG: DUF4097 family beta strand repeat protein [Nitrospinae bacterium]|nr:DUF4097 family beta strand repeat protein [Nitrospinota bacterium]